MLLAASVALAAVGLGLLLGLGSGGGSWVVGPLRTFAFAAALTVALTHLLPEALGELGAAGLILFAAAAVLPAWGELLRGLLGRPQAGGGHGGLALGAGYWGLLVHHVGDGLGLGAYSELPGGALAHADVLAALAVHTVPLVAVVTLAFRSQQGVRAAVERAGGLAAASIAGVVLSNAVPKGVAESLTAWIAAGVAGLLMHVVTHDLRRDLPTTGAARALDVAAAVLGVGTCAVGAEPELLELRHRLVDAFLRVAGLSAPALLLALVAAFALGHVKAPGLTRWLAPIPGAARGLDGAFVGAALAGGRLGILFWLGVTLTARISALRSAEPPAPLPPPDHERVPHHDEHTHAHSAHPHVHTELSGTPPTPLALVREAAPWIVTGLVLHALLVASLPQGSLAALGAPLALGGAAFCGLALELPAAAAVLLAVALWDRGLRPDAALAFAVMASAKVRLNPRALLITLLVGIGVGSGNTGVTLAALAMPAALSALAVALLTLAVALTLWNGGIRGLFAHVFHSHDSA